MFETWASLFSFSQFGSTSSWMHIPHADKLVHFMFYFTTTLLGYWMLKFEWLDKWSNRSKLLLIFGFSVGYGIIIEGLQLALTHDRSGEIMDIIANTFGSIFGIFIGKYFPKVNFLRNT
ncbi:MAG: VanZ family protein [Flavobacteriaceae bacterium]|nr:VanZ family protein [Flavobacteriaceae bacterium]